MKILHYDVRDCAFAAAICLSVTAWYCDHAVSSRRILLHSHENQLWEQKLAALQTSADQLAFYIMLSTNKLVRYSEVGLYIEDQRVERPQETQRMNIDGKDSIVY